MYIVIIYICDMCLSLILIAIILISRCTERGQGLEQWREATCELPGLTLHAESEGEQVFARKESSATFESCSLCIVRPHGVREGKAGVVISAILEQGLEISALQSCMLLKSQAENFYEARRACKW